MATTTSKPAPIIVATKVFIIIGMVIGFFYVWPAIIGFEALKRVNSPTKPDDYKSFAWLLMVLTNPLTGIIAGIMMLCTKDSDFPGYQSARLTSPMQYGSNANAQPVNNVYGANAVPNNAYYVPQPQPRVINQQEQFAKLNKIKQLHDNGILSDAEYEQYRQNILKGYI